MKVKDVKVNRSYWDNLHNDFVYCVEVFDNGNEDDSYIKSLSSPDGKIIKEVFLPTCFLNYPFTKQDSEEEFPWDTKVPTDKFYLSEGTIVVLPGEGVGVVYNYENEIDEANVLSVSGGILVVSSHPVCLDQIYEADDYFKSKFKKRLEKNGFYYDEKFKCIFKIGDLKSNLLRYTKPPKLWDEKIASTITGGFTGKVVPKESSYFDTTLISVTSDGMSPIKIKFKTSDLRVPTWEEIEKFEEKIKRASEDAKKEIESVG